jgi:hypothetical protein
MARADYFLMSGNVTVLGGQGFLGGGSYMAFWETDIVCVSRHGTQIRRRSCFPGTTLASTQCTRMYVISSQLALPFLMPMLW